MTLPTNESPKQVPLPGLAHGCPYLGLRVDPETHFSSPSPGNYCHKVKPSEPVLDGYQGDYCLRGEYQNCLVFADDWKGTLPKSIRGDGVAGVKTNRSKNQSVLPVLAVESAENSRKGNEKVESATINNNLNKNSPVNQNDYQTNNNDSESSPPWSKLYDEANQRYKEATPQRKDKFVWIGLLIVATVIFVISIWGVLNRVKNIRTQTELSILSAKTVIAITASYQKGISDSGTSTAQAIFLSGGLPEENSTPTPQVNNQNDNGLLATEIVLEPSPTIVSCDDFTGYPLELVSGPNLSPRQGYIYQEGMPEPIIQASWSIKNPGYCKWEQIVIQDTITGEKFVPILYKDGERLDLSNLEQAINPGEEFDLIVNFKINDAKSVNRDWVVILNGFPLFEQTHIILKIENWVSIIQSQITSTPSSKPTNDNKSTPTGNPSRGTDQPPTRAPSTPPTRSP